MKLKNVKEGQRVQIKDLQEPILVEYGQTRHKLEHNDILTCTRDGLDPDGHVRLRILDDSEVWYYYTTHDNLRKVK